MATYKTPDVYIEEISLFPPSVAEVETAIPAFIGYTEKAKKNVADDLNFVPTRISSLVEYEEYFGKANSESFEIDVVEDTTDKTYTVTAKRVNTGTLYRMYYSMKMFFDNGGGPCYIISVGDYSDSISKGDTTTPAGLLGGLAALEKEDEPTIIVFPDAVELSASADYYSVMDSALAQCKKLQDRVAVIDVHDQNTTTFRNTIRSDEDYVKYGAAYHPWLLTTINYNYTEDKVTIKKHVQEDGSTPTTDLTGKTLKSTEIKSSTNVLYNKIISELSTCDEGRVTLPPSSAVAGVYSRVDKDRGVWKAPANVPLLDVIKPTIKITSEDQESLNIDSTGGKSINAIRAFTGKGTLVWGARTLAGNSNEWRYVSVRRFYNMVEESVKKSTYWAVFEPNDANTWLKVKSMIENFLTKKWREGALAGAKADEAFFVKVGLGITMTSLDILEGRMNVEIGMAVVRPAEFIILKFSHKMQES
ncbi:MAG: phage tail sheath family protein [Melioribacteraceae bacterium]|nr:phage tail sheath family protein [Melioribacteraceae bacterium]